MDVNRVLPADVPYQELERQWTPLLRIFARWRIGMEEEDLMQEMRIVLLKAQASYEPDSGATFKTYLFRSLLNRALKLRKMVNGTASRIPPSAYVPIDDVRPPSYVDDVGLMEVLEGIDHTGVRTLVALIVSGDNTPTMRKLYGMTERGNSEARGKLRELLEGGR